MSLGIASTSARTFSSLRRHRNYRLFFAGQGVSLVGTWMQVVAQSWLVLQLTDSAVALSITIALQFVPMLVGGAWGGLIADRFDKRRTMVWTQVAAGVLALALGALELSGAVQLWHVYGFALLLGVVNVFDMPTRQAFVTEMVGPDDVANAVGLNAAMFNSARLVGPAVAGVVIARFGIGPAFIANGVSYVAAIVALSMMRPAELFVVPPVPRQPGQVRDGIRYVRHHPLLFPTLCVLAVVSTLSFNSLVILPLMAKKVFHGGPGLFGNLQAIMAVGSLVGSLGAAGRARPTRRLLLGASFALGVCSIAAAVAPNAWVEAVALVPLGVATMVFVVTANTTMQLNSDPAMRGRVMALYALVFLGSTPIGSPITGWFAQQWGPRAAFGFAGAAALVAVALGAVMARSGRRVEARVGELAIS